MNRKKISIIVIGLIIIFIVTFLLVMQLRSDKLYVNGKKLQVAISELDDKGLFDMSEDLLFDWDTLYIFNPQSEPERIYDVVGEEWMEVVKTDMNGNQLVFVNDGKVICYVNGESDIVGYLIKTYGENPDYTKVTNKGKVLFDVIKKDEITQLILVE